MHGRWCRWHILRRPAPVTCTLGRAMGINLSSATKEGGVSGMWRCQRVYRPLALGSAPRQFT